MMRRRELIAMLGGAAAAWPLRARAQRTGKLPTVGLLTTNSAQAEVTRTAAFVDRLRELGWRDGHTVQLLFRHAEGRIERASEIAAEFVRLKVDIIVVAGAAFALAAKKATATIPIVFTGAGDPVATGLVASLARPGGNVTGLSIQAPDLVGKRLQLLREAVPGLQRLAILGNAGNPTDMLQIDEAQAAAHTLGVDLMPVPVRRADDIGPALDALRGRVDGLYVSGDPLMVINRAQIATLAQDARLPTICNAREFIAAGGLMSYGPNFPDLYRRAGDHVDKILRGAKPADIPVEQPTKFDLVINLKTARTLKLTISEAFLLRADEVLE